MDAELEWEGKRHGPDENWGGAENEQHALYNILKELVKMRKLPVF